MQIPPSSAPLTIASPSIISVLPASIDRIVAPAAFIASIVDAPMTGTSKRMSWFGFAPEVVIKLKRSFRYLLQSKLNTTRALHQIEQDRSLACAEVQYLVDFIRTSQRGVILRRPSRRTEEVVADE